jgi:Ca-activated chloride channel family protein
MTFASPTWLLALALVPLAMVAYVVAQRRARRYAVRFTAVSTLQLAAGKTPSWRRLLPPLLALLAIAALALALARPRLPYQTPVDEASIMLVTDHSGSMASGDVSPSRLAAAERAADSFIDHLPPKVRVGAVAFGTAPDGVQAPATDHRAAKAIINAQIANGSTATGNALQLALQLLRGSDSKHPPSAIVLLSDGAANAGVNVISIAQTAKHERIPIDTVALGTSEGTLPNPDPFGPPISVPPDPQLMQQIADASGGRSFNAHTADELGSIYTHLGNELGSVTHRREVTYMFVAGGLALLLLAGLGSVRWSPRLP